MPVTAGTVRVTEGTPAPEMVVRSRIPRPAERNSGRKTNSFASNDGVMRQERKPCGCTASIHTVCQMPLMRV